MLLGQRAEFACAATADRVIAVLSPDYVLSRYGEAEWRVFFARDPSGEQALLLPIRVREVEPPGLLRTKIYVDLVGRDGKTARDLLLAAARGARGKPASEPEFPGRERQPQYDLTRRSSRRIAGRSTTPTRFRRAWHPPHCAPAT